MYYNLLNKLNALLEIADENGVITFDSGLESEQVVSIVALTHGNEVSGLYVFDWLINEFDIKNKIQKGKLQLILGNYQAFLRKTDDERLSLRFIDRDFNRVWGEDGIGVEYNRKSQLKSYIVNSKAILDIHSTSLPSIPMIIPASDNPVTKSILSNMKGDYILNNIMSCLNGMPLVKYHSSIDKENISILLECGQHFDEISIENAKFNTLSFMSSFGLIDFDDQINQTSKNLHVYDCLLANSLDIDYIYNHSPQSFDFIKKGELIAKIGEKEIFCPEDSYIVMPTKKLVYLNEEVFYLAKTL